jgi:hypothetical protein
MSKIQKKRQYCRVEHLWRILRALFLLAGTGLWLYTECNNHLIFGLFVSAAAVDQLHGVICHLIEKLLGYEEQHDDWE